MESQTSTENNLVLDLISDARSHEQWEALLNANFPVGEGASFFDDFPVWKRELSPPETLKIGAFRDGQLASAAAARIALMRTEDADVRVAILGGVVTHPSHRGRGLASNIVSFALEWAESQNAQAILLWTQEHALYERLGFQQVGRQVTVPLSRIQLRQNVSIQVNEGWVPALFEKLKNRPLGLRLTDSDLGWVSAHKNVRWFWSGSPENPTAYAAIGKGIDLTGLVHEWGGDPRALASLLFEVRNRVPYASVLGHPVWLAANLLCEEALTARFEPLCMARSLRGDGALPEPLWLWGVDGA